MCRIAERGRTDFCFNHRENIFLSGFVFFFFFFPWLVDDKIYIYAMKSSETFSLMNLVDFNCELSLTILVWPIRIGVRTAATPAADAFE